MDKVNNISAQTLSIGVIVKDDIQHGRIIIRHTKNTYEIGVLFGELNFGTSVKGKFEMLYDLFEYLENAEIHPMMQWHGKCKQWMPETESVVSTLNRLKYKDEIFTVVWGLS